MEGIESNVDDSKGVDAKSKNRFGPNIVATSSLLNHQLLAESNALFSGMFQYSLACSPIRGLRLL